MDCVIQIRRSLRCSLIWIKVGQRLEKLDSLLGEKGKHFICAVTMTVTVMSESYHSRRHGGRRKRHEEEEETESGGSSSRGTGESSPDEPSRNVPLHRVLKRQDTFVLTSPSVLRKKTDARGTDEGVEAVLERASHESGLSGEVREYITSHFKMIREENNSLRMELQGRRANGKAEEMDKQIKMVTRQLEKEKVKNKLLMKKMKEGGGEEEDGGIVWVGGGPASSADGSVDGVRTRTVTPVSLDTHGGGGEDDKKEAHLNKKIRVYRNQVHNLRMEMDQLKLMLKEEIGDDIDYRSLKEHGWKGRSDQIANLKQTVETLQRLLVEAKQQNAATSFQEGPRAHSVLSEHYFADSEMEEGRNAQEQERNGPSRGSEASETGSESLKRQCEEYRWLSQASEAERTRLGELVKLLTSRLSLAEERVGEAEAAWREERSRAVHLETMVERLQVELREVKAGGGMLSSSFNSGRSVSSVGRRVGEDELESVDVERLRNEVDRLKEEARAGRRELGEARGAREEMVRIYQAMLEETRSIFQRKPPLDNKQ